MKITLLGALAIIGIAALLVYIASELQRANQAKAAQPPQNPIPSPTKPDPSIEP